MNIACLGPAIAHVTINKYIKHNIHTKFRPLPLISNPSMDTE
jgi:hypothetical protein